MTRREENEAGGRARIRVRPGPERDLTDDIDLAKALFEDGIAVEDVIRELRARGCIQVQVTEVLRRAAGFSHEEAKRAVVYSEAWRDLREATLDLHNNIETALRRPRANEEERDGRPMTEQ